MKFKSNNIKDPTNSTYIYSTGHTKVISFLKILIFFNQQ